MNLDTEPYVGQVACWPRQGRHILAHHDAETVVVYQAYRPAIGTYAIEQCVFGGECHSIGVPSLRARSNQAFCVGWLEQSSSANFTQSVSTGSPIEKGIPPTWWISPPVDGQCAPNAPGCLAARSRQNPR